jgi:hypothetical protein
MPLSPSPDELLASPGAGGKGCFAGHQAAPSRLPLVAGLA